MLETIIRDVIADVLVKKDLISKQQRGFEHGGHGIVKLVLLEYWSPREY